MNRAGQVKTVGDEFEFSGLCSKVVSNGIQVTSTPHLEIVGRGGGGGIGYIGLLSVDLVPVVWINWFQVVQSNNWSGKLFRGL